MAEKEQRPFAENIKTITDEMLAGINPKLHTSVIKPAAENVLKILNKSKDSNDLVHSYVAVKIIDHVEKNLPSRIVAAAPFFLSEIIAEALTEGHESFNSWQDKDKRCLLELALIEQISLREKETNQARALLRYDPGNYLAYSWKNMAKENQDITKVLKGRLKRLTQRANPSPGRRR